MSNIVFDQARKETLIQSVHELADRLCEQLSNKEHGVEKEKLLHTFKQCFVNTIETTVECLPQDEIFVITGDIEAMWLRDSSAQVAHYLPFANEYEDLATMIKALIHKQFQYICIDPYANAFNIEENGNCWDEDITDSNDWEWERKYEIDSLCYPIKLLSDYYRITNDASVFTQKVYEGLQLIVRTWRIEQHHAEQSSYRFTRLNCPASDTLHHDGMGNPTGYTGMTWSGFRPSDDACQYGYLVPANLFAETVLTNVADIASNIYNDAVLAEEALSLQADIRKGIEQFGMVEHETYGKIYAYEVDGLGHVHLMDDANVPSLLSLPWLGACDAQDEIYKNTRKFVLSKDNPYYYEGSAAKGIGSPHTPDQYIWHIALSMQGLTSIDPKEQEELLATLLRTDAGTGYMHEGFHCDRPDEFTRDWFAWSNSLFALYVLTMYGLIA